MGDGLVLEQGTHSELLQDKNGPYARLVASQKLREKREVELKESDSDTITGEAEDMEKKARDEVPLGRKNSGSGHSLASEIIAQKKQHDGEKKEDDFSLPYLFMRMGKLNRAGWSNYGVGFIAACCMRSCVSFMIFLTGLDSERHGLPGLWHRFCQSYRRIRRP